VVSPERLRRRARRDGPARRAARGEGRLSLALRTAGIALWELDVDGGALWWSDETGFVLGAGSGPAEGRGRLEDALARVHPEDREGIRAALAEALAGGGAARRVQARVLEDDGSVRWLEACGEAWTDEDGRRRGLRGSVADVTERKAAEEAARRGQASRRLLVAIAEASMSADEDALLERVTELLRGSLFPETCGFLLLDAEGGVLRYAPSFRSRRAANDLRPIGFGMGVAGAVAASGAARRIDDLAGEPDEAALDPECRSEVCVPVKVGPRILGVLAAASTRPAAFTEADERLLGVAASQVAGALQRLRSEEALRESGELYRAYFTASPIALFVSDMRGRYLEVNGAACALTGYAREELVTMSLADLLGGDDARAVAERLVGLLALGAGRSEIRLRRRDGSTRHCLVHATPIGADRLLGLLLDVTEGREAEEKLRESEDRFRSLSEAGFEALLVHDGGRIVDVNQAFCELVGYKWHEIVGRNAFDFLVPPEYRELAYRNMLAEHDRPYEIEGIGRDGSRIPVEIQARSLPYRGEVLRVVAIRDISERKKAERVRESLIRELEAKNVELERFGYTVTHDLKAPLVTIRGFADYVERDLREGRTDRLAADARRIGEAVGKLQQLLDELFEVSRAGRPVGPPVAVPAEEIVQEALRLVSGDRPEVRSRVRVSGPLPVLFGDRARLVQVFRNLLDNGIKFAAGAAEPLVTVEARPPLDGKAVLAVRDNGIGIEARHRDRVLDLFEKLDPRAAGSGVGLAVVKRVVESHGGRVWLESEGRGAGTTACVTLPMAVPAAGGGEPTAAAERRGG
jgi:PAS domain S-box-containing protein